MYTDKTLVCKDCGREFVFSASEQEFYAEKGFENEPRDAGTAGLHGRQTAVGATVVLCSTLCAECGKPCKVPFEPRNDQPVFCSECFKNHRG